MILVRRAFIRHVAESVATAAGAVIFPAARSRYSGNPSIVTVGRRYLALHPHEASAVALARSLAADRSLRPAVRVRRDFTRGDVVVIDGWLVTRSEARTCAIASLAPNDAD